MIGESKKFYITTTLPYINANPHIGFALEVVQADVVARWRRQEGDEVFFNTGTDEHGLKVFQRAQEENINIQEFCDERAQKFADLKKALNLSYNSFIRTTNPRHIEAAQEFWKLCQKNGDIYKKRYRIKYCVGCELEKTDSELRQGRCPLHPNRELEIGEEENYFFRYSRYQKQLLELYRKQPDFVLPQARLNEIVSFTEKELKDFSISRLKEKLPWGIPVPGDEEQVMYVWFDALINYISCLGWPDDSRKFKEFWPGMQIAGKDNLRQQASMWQAMLMSAGLPPSRQILIHGFITSGGVKMSKSLGNVVDPFELTKSYGADAVRYYLLREFSPFEDGDFTIEKFKERYNSDLANGIGNLAARALTLAAKSGIKGIKKSRKIKDRALSNCAGEAKKKRREALSGFKFNEALAAVWELIAFCDKHIEEKRPWENKESSKDVIADILLGLLEIADMLYPFLPRASERILEQIEKGEAGKPLFPRIE